MLLVLAIVLSQMCDSGLECSPGGFQSFAPGNYGSGAPDFTCGQSDPLADGGWGPQTRYCSILTQNTPGYDGYHGDLTIGSRYDRTAGWLFHIYNHYFGAPVFTVAWQGDVWTHGDYLLSTNGAGVRNTASYLPLYGASADPVSIPDVVVVPGVAHLTKSYNFGIWTGYSWTLRVRDDGYLSTNNITVKIDDSGDGIRFTEELVDGGVRRATLPWGP